MDYKVCKVCGNKFIPNARNQTVCNKAHYANCVICGNKILLKSRYVR